MIGGELYLHTCPETTQQKFINEILILMGAHAGGMSYFTYGCPLNQVISSWTIGLRMFKPRAILEAVHHILDGKYDRNGNLIPRSVIEFKWFLRKMGEHLPQFEASEDEVRRLTFDTITARQKSEVCAKEAMEKLSYIFRRNNVSVCAPVK